MRRFGPAPDCRRCRERPTQRFKNPRLVGMSRRIRRRLRARDTTSVVCRVALLGMVLVLAVIAYYPFAWDPPRLVRNEVTRSADGSLRFGKMNYARTSGTPAWLQDVRSSETIQIQLEAYPQTLQQYASIMMLASDYWHTDFVVQQGRSDLMVWLRRPGLDANGNPPFVIDGVLRPGQWNSVNLTLRHGDLRIEVDGRTRLTDYAAADFLSVWSPGQIALGDEVHGGAPWQGKIRLAEIRAPGYAVDYVRPGALSIPERYFYFPDRIEPFPPGNGRGQLYLFFEVLSFTPVGFLIVWARRPPVRPVPATLLAAALAVVLGAGKLLFAAQHEVVADIVMQVIGALLGVVLATRLAHAKRSTVWLRGACRISATPPELICVPTSGPQFHEARSRAGLAEGGTPVTAAGTFRFLAPMPRLCGDPRTGNDAAWWAAELRRIEDLGFHAVAVSEHYSRGWTMDALTAMNFALANTTRLRAIPLVLNNDLHHPAILAKAIATADVLSGGRAAVGIGAGWLVDDYKALGASYDTASIRIDRLTEALQVITMFFSGLPMTFCGRYYRLDGLEALPRSVQDPRPPVLVGGGGPRMLALAGSLADIAAVHAQLGPGGFDAGAAEGLSRASIGKKISRVAAAASEAGRPVPAIQFSCYDVNIAGVQVTPIRPSFSDFIDAHPASFADSPTSLRGEIAKCVDDLQRWQDELGISYWNLGGNVDAIAPIVAQLSAE